ncbi:hypothetical protein [Corynebacterium accolens]|uniref:hypothetical protein n=1 Tax=Corynebacterium accolens TaxID=38284 RepID=UPI00254F8B22|nr:hypothetical protein [Corynebacterium accolens]MDK8469855.1 hypothetical protein [Corynebacterium accolens]
MTDLTTSNLKRLLGQATTGPWEFHEEEEMEHVAGPEYPPMLVYLEHIVEDSDGKCLFGNSNDKFLEDYPGNLRLAALAPQLAQEVIRIRDGVEQIREMCLLERDAAFQHTPMHAAFNICAEQLTALLDGEEE